MANFKYTVNVTMTVRVKGKSYWDAKQELIKTLSKPSTYVLPLVNVEDVEFVERAGD